MKTLEDFLKDKLTGKDVLQIRKILHVSQDKFSKIIGVTSASVYLWEKNKVAISSENQNKILRMINDITEYAEDAKVIQ